MGVRCPLTVEVVGAKVCRRLPYFREIWSSKTRCHDCEENPLHGRPKVLLITIHGGFLLPGFLDIDRDHQERACAQFLLAVRGFDEDVVPLIFAHPLPHEHAPAAFSHCHLRSGGSMARGKKGTRRSVVSVWRPTSPRIDVISRESSSFGGAPLCHPRRPLPPRRPCPPVAWTPANDVQRCLA